MPTTKRKEREAQRGLGSVKRMGQPPAGAVAYDEERALYKDGDGIVLTPEVVAQRRRERKKAATPSRKRKKAAAPSTKLRRGALIFDAVALGHDADHVASPEEDGAEGDGPDACGERQVVPSECGSPQGEFGVGSPGGLGGGDGDGAVPGDQPSEEPGCFSTSVYTREEWGQWHREHGVMYWDVYVAINDLLTFFVTELTYVHRGDGTPGLLVSLTYHGGVTVFVPDIALVERTHVHTLAWSDPEFDVDLDMMSLRTAVERLSDDLKLRSNGRVFGSSSGRPMSEEELLHVINHVKEIGSIAADAHTEHGISSPPGAEDDFFAVHSSDDPTTPLDDSGVATPSGASFAEPGSPTSDHDFPRHPMWNGDGNEWYQQPVTPNSVPEEERRCCICLFADTPDSDEFKLGTCVDWTTVNCRNGSRDEDCSCSALFHRSCLRKASSGTGREVVNCRDRCAMRFKPCVLPCVPDCCVGSVFAA